MIDLNIDPGQTPTNTQQDRYYLYLWGEAHMMRDLLVPEHATKADIHKDDCRYWLNVWWRHGVIAPLTVNGLLQTQGEK